MQMEDAPLPRVDEIHVWQFPFNTTVELNPKFIDKINLVRKEKFASVREFHNSLQSRIKLVSFKELLKPSFPNFRDLHILLQVCKILGLSEMELERNVVAYQFKRSRVTIRNPILPIRVTPLFPMIVAHMVADGNIVRFNDKTTFFFSYRQYDSKLRLLLFEKAKALFGDLVYKDQYFIKETRIYIPEVLTRVICDYYGLKSDGFLSKSALLPQKIMNSPEQHQLAVLIAFIIDEGSVDSTEIAVALKNEPLVSQLSIICDKLGYDNSVSRTNKYGMAALHILKSGLEKFWGDYQRLKSEFSQVDLGYREEKIKIDLLRFQKQWKSRGKNHSKNEMMRALKEKPLTVWALSEKLNISCQGIQFQLKSLYSRGLLGRERVKERAYLYSLIREQNFAETSLGRSRAIGLTEKELKKRLTEPKTTIELIQAVGVEKSTVRNILKRLHKNGDIVLIGKQYTGSVPSKLWQLRP